jgi:hypothetical protein
METIGQCDPSGNQNDFFFVCAHDNRIPDLFTHERLRKGRGV